MEDAPKVKKVTTRRSKKSSGSTLLALPKHIELICTKTAKVREFELIHANNILRLQNKSNLGSYTVFNTDLYTYNEGSRTIEHNVRQSESSEGDTITSLT